MGSLDVAHSLGVTLGLEGLLGVQGSLETHGSLLERHVNLVTVLRHLSLNIVELSSGGSNKSLDLVVSPSAGGLVLRSELSRETAASGLGVATEVGDLVVPRVHSVLKVLARLLGVLLDLGSVGSDVLVHAVDASVGSRCPRGGGCLPALHGHAKVVSLLTTIVSGHLDGAAVATESGAVPTVGKAGLLGETLLCLTHGVVQVIAALLGVDSHLVEHLPLELGASSRVESEVASHLSTDRRDVGLAVGNLIRDLLLDVVEVVHQAHAAIRGLGVDLPSLEDISAAHRGTSIVALNDLVNVFLTGISSNVHYGAARSQTAKESEAHAHLLLRISVHPKETRE